MSTYEERNRHKPQGYDLISASEDGALYEDGSGNQSFDVYGYDLSKIHSDDRYYIVRTLHGAEIEIFKALQWRQEWEKGKSFRKILLAITFFQITALLFFVLSAVFLAGSSGIILASVILACLSVLIIDAFWEIVLISKAEDIIQTLVLEQIKKDKDIQYFRSMLRALRDAHNIHASLMSQQIKL